jgi:hypothetical protein
MYLGMKHFLSDLVDIVNVSVNNTLINFKDLVGSLRDLFPGFKFEIS